MSVVEKLDELGKPAWIGLMVVSFVLFWPAGLAVLAVGAAAAGCGALEEPTAEMPADSAAGEIAFSGTAAMVVPVHVNGDGPLNFALDTGATLTCVDQRLAERLDTIRAELQAFGQYGFLQVGHVEARNPMSSGDELAAECAEWMDVARNRRRDDPEVLHALRERLACE